MSLSAFCFDVLAAEDLAFPLPDADLRRRYQSA